MMNCTARKCALAIVFLLVFAASGRAQTAPTPEQLEFVNVLGKRLRAASETEVKARNDQLQPSITLEKQFEDNRIKLEREIATLAGRIQTLSWAASSCPSIRPAIDQAMKQANQEQNILLVQLNKTNDALNDAREQRLKTEKAAAWQLGNSAQLLNDFDYLFKAWQMDPPQYTLQAMMDHLTAVARDKKVKSKVTISTGDSKATPIKYQLVSGGPVNSATNSVAFLIDPGDYKFWIDKPGSADSPKKCLIFREAHSIDLNAKECH